MILTQRFTSKKSPKILSKRFRPKTLEKITQNLKQTFSPKLIRDFGFRTGAPEPRAQHFRAVGAKSENRFVKIDENTNRLVKILSRKGGGSKAEGGRGEVNLPPKTAS